MENTHLLQIRRLGLVEYADGLALMVALAAARRAGNIPDTLVLLQHNPVITLGRGAREESNLLHSRQEYAQKGVELFEIDRGGDVTFHGPGQLVCYPIFNLDPDRKDVRKYVRNIEETVIQTLAPLGIEASRMEKLPGVWVGDEKIAAVGVRIHQWITSHGFALNVSTDMDYFSLIVPCGIPEKKVSSITQQLGKELTLEEVEEHVIRAASKVFDKVAEVVEIEKHTASVYLWRKTPRGPEVLLLKRTQVRGDFWQPVTGQVELGEAPDATAARECEEETGLQGAPQPLPYVHSFCWPQRKDGKPPRFLTEHAFHIEVHDPAWEPTLDPVEHTAWKWEPLETTESEVPFTGLKRGVQRLTKIIAS